MYTGEITRLAFQAVSEDRLKDETYSDPEAVFLYLKEDFHFKSLAVQLRETMEKSGFCEGNPSNSQLADTLYSLLAKQDSECGKDKPISKVTVNRWFSGITKSIRKRSTIIEICFALGLSLELATEFMDKCGHTRLNVRNASDAVYLYCILNHRPYAAARKIITAYSDAAINEPINHQQAEISHTHSGDTTLILEDTILNGSDWDSDEAFLNTFLIPNKEKFIGYAFSAEKEYYILKNKLFTTVFQDALSKEAHLVEERNHLGQSRITKDDIPVSLAFRSALRKYTEPSSSFYEINLLLKEDMSNAKEVFLRIADIVYADNDIKKQKEISLFLGDVMKIESFLKYVISSIICKGMAYDPLFTEITTDQKKERNSKERITMESLEMALSQTDEIGKKAIKNTIREKRDLALHLLSAVEHLSADDIASFNFVDLEQTAAGTRLYRRKDSDNNGLSYIDLDPATGTAIQSYLYAKGIGRIRRYTDSCFSETVMSEFPDGKTFHDFENDPSVIQEGMSVRKAIILMYYIAYAYELTRYLSDLSYPSIQFGAMGLEEFLNGSDENHPGLNQLLKECRLSPMYPANQFDWLILRSIQEIIIEEDDEDWESPVSFLNQVIAYSFEEQSTDTDESAE